MIITFTAQRPCPADPVGMAGVWNRDAGSNGSCGEVMSP